MLGTASCILSRTHGNRCSLTMPSVSPAKLCPDTARIKTKAQFLPCNEECTEGWSGSGVERGGVLSGSYLGYLGPLRWCRRGKMHQASMIFRQFSGGAWLIPTCTNLHTFMTRLTSPPYREHLFHPPATEDTRATLMRKAEMRAWTGRASGSPSFVAAE